MINTILAININNMQVLHSLDVVGAVSKYGIDTEYGKKKTPVKLYVNRSLTKKNIDLRQIGF